MGYEGIEEQDGRGGSHDIGVVPFRLGMRDPHERSFSLKSLSPSESTPHADNTVQDKIIRRKESSSILPRLQKKSSVPLLRHRYSSKNLDHERGGNAALSSSPRRKQSIPELQRSASRDSRHLSNLSIPQRAQNVQDSSATDAETPNRSSMTNTARRTKSYSTLESRQNAASAFVAANTKTISGDGTQWKGVSIMLDRSNSSVSHVSRKSSGPISQIILPQQQQQQQQQQLPDQIQQQQRASQKIEQKVKTALPLPTVIPVSPEVAEEFHSDIVLHPFTSELIASTPQDIINYITSPMIVDYSLVADFFLTYRSYYGPKQLLSALLDRYTSTLSSVAELDRAVRIRTFVCLRHWLLNYFGDDFVPSRTLRTRLATKLNSLSRDQRILNSVLDKTIVKELKRSWSRLLWIFYGASYAASLQISIEDDVGIGGDVEAIRLGSSTVALGKSIKPSDVALTNSESATSPILTNKSMSPKLSKKDSPRKQKKKSFISSSSPRGRVVNETCQQIISPPQTDRSPTQISSKQLPQGRTLKRKPGGNLKEASKVADLELCKPDYSSSISSIYARTVASFHSNWSLQRYFSNLNTNDKSNEKVVNMQVAVERLRQLFANDDVSGEGVDEALSKLEGRGKITSSESNRFSSIMHNKSKNHRRNRKIIDGFAIRPSMSVSSLAESFYSSKDMPMNEGQPDIIGLGINLNNATVVASDGLNIIPNGVMNSYVSPLHKFQKQLNEPKLYPLHASIFLSTPPRILAKQFCLCERTIILNLDWKDIVDRTWQKCEVVDAKEWSDIEKDITLSSVEKILARYELGHRWMLWNIIDAQNTDEQADIIERMILLSLHSHRMHNFSTFYQTITALTKVHNASFAKTWKKVSRSSIAIFDFARRICYANNNYYIMRLEMASSARSQGAQNGYVPFIEPFLNDLKQISAQSLYIKPPIIHARSLINFQRQRAIAAVVKEILHLTEYAAAYKIQPRSVLYKKLHSLELN